MAGCTLLPREKVSLAHYTWQTSWMSSVDWLDTKQILTQKLVVAQLISNSPVIHSSFRNSPSHVHILPLSYRTASGGRWLPSQLANCEGFETKHSNNLDQINPIPILMPSPIAILTLIRMNHLKRLVSRGWMEDLQIVSFLPVQKNNLLRRHSITRVLSQMNLVFTTTSYFSELLLNIILTCISRSS